MSPEELNATLEAIRALESDEPRPLESAIKAAQDATRLLNDGFTRLGKELPVPENVRTTIFQQAHLHLLFGDWASGWWDFFASFGGDGMFGTILQVKKRTPSDRLPLPINQKTTTNPDNDTILRFAIAASEGRLP
jgi:hypothetical protein